MLGSSSALSLLKEERPTLSFGCAILDRAVGRLQSHGITEIAGEAGAGKTQFCLNLSLQCQQPSSSGGLGGACAYIACGEGDFPIRRLNQLASAQPGTSLENVHIEQCYSPEDMLSTLKNKIPEIQKELNIKLLIIDSVAGLLRYEYDVANKAGNELFERTQYLFRFANALKWLADTFKICIVVTNQVD